LSYPDNSHHGSNDCGHLQLVAINGRIIVPGFDAITLDKASGKRGRRSFWWRLLQEFACACELYHPVQLHERHQASHWSTQRAEITKISEAFDPRL